MDAPLSLHLLGRQGGRVDGTGAQPGDGAARRSPLAQPVFHDRPRRAERGLRVEVQLADHAQHLAAFRLVSAEVLQKDGAGHELPAVVLPAHLGLVRVKGGGGLAAAPTGVGNRATPTRPGLGPAGEPCRAGGGVMVGVATRPGTADRAVLRHAGACRWVRACRGPGGSAGPPMPSAGGRTALARGAAMHEEDRRREKGSSPHCLGSPDGREGEAATCAMQASACPHRNG